MDQTVRVIWRDHARKRHSEVLILRAAPGVQANGYTFADKFGDFFLVGSMVESIVPVGAR